MLHILISLVEEKLDHIYKKVIEKVNKAAGEKNIQLYEESMGQKLTMDTHIVGKNTLNNFKAFFTFSSTLVLYMNASFISE